jgi:SAM-dependent methyltransferase
MSDLTATAWEDRYQTDNTPWDLVHPAPVFVGLLDSDQCPHPGSMAVLGCGKGHDALLFAAAGFEVVGFDFAQSPIEQAQATATAKNLKAQFLQRDIFDLVPEFLQGFDFVLEHTCFCAIDPSLRSQYVQLVKSLLRPQGKLIALFFTHNRPGGPPFGIQPAEVLELFTPEFEPLRFEPNQQSVASRQGEEYLGIFQLRSQA